MPQRTTITSLVKDFWPMLVGIGVFAILANTGVPAGARFSFTDREDLENEIAKLREAMTVLEKAMVDPKWTDEQLEKLQYQHARYSEFMTYYQKKLKGWE